MPPPTHSTRPPLATHLFSSRVDRAALKAGLHRRNGIHVGGAQSMRPSVGFSCHKLNVTVDGCAAFYSAVLSAAPESPVTISPGSLPTCIRITPTVHVFTKDNWMKPQFFRISAVTTSAFDDAASSNGGNSKVDRKFLQVIEHFSSSADPRFGGNRLLYAPASILVYVTPREGSYIFTSGRALGTAKQVGKSIVNEIHHAFVSLEHGIPVRGQPKDLVARSSMITMQSAHTTAATAAAVAAVQAANTATQAAATRRMSSKRNLFGPPTPVSDVVSVSSGSTGLGSGPNTAGPLGGEMMDGMFQHLSKDAHSFTKVVCRKNQTILLQRNGQMIALGKRDVDTSGSSLAPGSPRQRGKDGSSDPDSISDAALCNMLADVDCGDDHAMAITEQGYLLSWGNGKDGRLGHGTEDSRESPRLVKALFHKRIVHVACGARHSFVLAEDGDVFSWGDGRAGALGHGMNPESRTLDSVVAPLEVLTLKQKGVVKISCGDMHTAVVLINGSLLTCGWAEHGRLGRPYSKDDYSSYFAPVDLKGHLCTYVVCGGAHTLGLTESKAIFAFGSNSSGQLGLGDCRHRSAPALLTYFDDDHAVVTGIAAGKMHSSATTQDGRLFAWGSDEFGQCGIGSFPQLYTAPHLVASTVGLGVTQVGGGDGHSVVLCQGSHRHLDALEANHPTRYSDLMDKFELLLHHVQAKPGQHKNEKFQEETRCMLWASSVVYNHSRST
ncbi:hypothetical protein Poli38472_002966 [Pythium oligandrum]|uniref:RCC1-like domain-containing protein n=1 Tax=Pythium oligandrum TaxID=41045 RepID=A0A8K1C5Y3_PYTOL|nr:hypothetical protein Poli38472_002966 [Pythium oligandrum]|eukprot:TMW57041.1 hypothetical protein Poli38472_002966 [Pythium oligandrum]